MTTTSVEPWREFFIDLHVVRQPGDVVLESIALWNITRISPLTRGERESFGTTDGGARVYLGGHVVSLVTVESVDEIRTLVNRGWTEEQPPALLSDVSDALDAALAGKPVLSVWRHQTRQTRYGLLGFARVQSAVSLNEGDMAAVYVSLDAMAADGNDLWVRPQNEFLDGRFTEEKPQ